jgi:hypothetical protein
VLSYVALVYATGDWLTIPAFVFSAVAFVIAAFGSAQRLTKPTTPPAQPKRTTSQKVSLWILRAAALVIVPVAALVLSGIHSEPRSLWGVAIFTALASGCWLWWLKKTRLDYITLTAAFVALVGAGFVWLAHNEFSGWHWLISLVGTYLLLAGVTAALTLLYPHPSGEPGVRDKLFNRGTA